MNPCSDFIFWRNSQSMSNTKSASAEGKEEKNRRETASGVKAYSVHAWQFRMTPTAAKKQCGIKSGWSA